MSNSLTRRLAVQRPEDAAAKIIALEAENARLRAALEKAFLTLGRAGGNSMVPGPHDASHSEIREGWLAAREALKQQKGA